MRLIIAEKESVAKEIAKLVKANNRENGCLVGQEDIVSWCYGHLVELSEPVAYDSALKYWKLDTLPIIPETFKTEVSAGKVKQFNILKGLMARPDVTNIVEATDGDREGELIFRLVYEKAGCKKKFSRLWISSMEEKSIQDALNRLKPGSEYDNLFQAALCRQRADWLIGINLTRLYSIMYHETFPCGRVQTPTINLIVERQKEIESFIPSNYYNIIADCGMFKAYSRVEDKDCPQQVFERCKGNNAFVSVVKRQEKNENPPMLYDTTTLMSDANRLFGYRSQQTLDYMQSLYENKLATYPRTSSRFLTADQEQSTRNLINRLISSNIVDAKILDNYSIEDIDITKIINDKKVEEHHAFIPTGNVTQEKLESLPTGERNILRLISYRLLAAVYAPYIYTATKVVFDINGEAFTATGREEIQIGFKGIERYVNSFNVEDVEGQEDEREPSLPAMSEGDVFFVKDISLHKKKTQPPKPYTEGTLLLAMKTAGKDIADDKLREIMKECGLGTDATRAGIIENIIKSGYVKREGRKLLPTDTARTFIDLTVDLIKSPELTAKWEKQLADIQHGQGNETDFMDSVTGFIRSFISDAKALYIPEERESIGVCPKCGKNVVEYQKAFSCESGKNGCGFVIWKVIAGKNVSKAQAQKLLNKGKSDLIKGLKSKKGNLFEAYLILKEDKQVGFEYKEDDKGGSR